MAPRMPEPSDRPRLSIVRSRPLSSRATDLASSARWLSPSHCSLRSRSPTSGLRPPPATLAASTLRSARASTRSPATTSSNTEALVGRPTQRGTRSALDPLNRLRRTPARSSTADGRSLGRARPEGDAAWHRTSRWRSWERRVGKVAPSPDTCWPTAGQSAPYPPPYERSGTRTCRARHRCDPS